MLKILLAADWPQGSVTIERTANSRRVVPEVEAAIDAAWAQASARLGNHLFDGPVCRMESWQASDDRLHLQLSPSSYKPFLGTNMTHPEFADRFGADVMANTVGVSPALLSSDGYLLMGKRTATVAYYPNRIHPFAGSLEPRDTDVFAAIHRELREELSLEPQDIIDLRCTGIAEDQHLRQPELIFAARSSLTKSEIESRLDPKEHRAMWSTPGTPDGIETAISDRDQLTPVAVASLVLWGRLQFGDGWFDRILREAKIQQDARG
jgi:8-oxo-dGTP pyrophosphatase MutT (NUDIX family)